MDSGEAVDDEMLLELAARRWVFGSLGGDMLIVLEGLVLGLMARGKEIE